MPEIANFSANKRQKTEAALNSSDQNELLVVVIDTNPNAIKSNPSILPIDRMIETSHAQQVKVLFPSKSNPSGHVEQFGKVYQTVRKRLAELTQATFSGNSPSAISAALSKALCFIHQSSTQLGAPGARILVVQRSPDASEQYIPIMNAIFSAQKQYVPVDACILSDAESAFMQQASFLTGGIYMRLAPSEQQSLFQYLLFNWLPNPASRAFLELPKQSKVDFRAVCFCCRKTISIAYICPVCLSIFCEFSPICSTCGVRSQLKTLQPGSQLLH